MTEPLAEDTLVILLSDHGEMAGEQGRSGKKTAYDGSMRVPLIVRYPGQFPAGNRVSSLVDVSVDTMPTLLEACKIAVPDAVQGISYFSLLSGGSEPTRNEVYYEIIMERGGPERVPVPERGVRTLGWLYVRTKDSPKMLFDLKNDPLEMNNLVEDSKYSDIIKELDRLLYEHMTNTDDDWEIEAIFPPPNFMTHKEGAENMKAIRNKAIIEH